MILDAKAGKCNRGRRFCPKLWSGTSLDSSPGDGKDGTSIIPCKLEDGRVIQRQIDHLQQQQHTSNRVMRNDHTNTPKKDSIEGREDKEFTEGAGLY